MLVDVKIEIPNGYELTDLVPVQLDYRNLFLTAGGSICEWKSKQSSKRKYFRVRKIQIQEPPKVEVRLKPGWLAKDADGNVWWYSHKPTFVDCYYGATEGYLCACDTVMLSCEFPEGVTLMEVI